jgi:single-stranded DNA-binding protein
MTSPFKHENVIKLAGVLGVAPELRLTANGNAVATLIVYTNYILRNEDGSRGQESERHRVILWGCTPRRWRGCCARAVRSACRAA